MVTLPTNRATNDVIEASDIDAIAQQVNTNTAAIAAAVAPGDATTSTKGVVQLAGDLGGSAAAPTVPTKVGVTGGGGETVLSASVSGTYTINLASANVFNLTVTGDTTFSFTGWPSGKSGQISVRIIQDGTGGRKITWPTGIWWSDKTIPSASVAASSVDRYEFCSIDGGTTVEGFQAGHNLGVGRASFQAAVLATTPMYYLPLDTTTGNFVDASPNGHVGAPVGTITRGVNALVPSEATVTGARAITLDGTSGYVSMDAGPVGVSNTASFSFACTINAPAPASSSVQGRIYASAHTSADTNPLFFLGQPAGSPLGQMRCFLRDSTGVLTFDVTSNGTVFDSTTHFVVFTYTASTGAWAIYIDGVLDKSGTGTPNANAFTVTHWAWGTQLRDTASNFLAGSLDDVAAWTRALTASDVSTLYASWTA